jgi:ParB family chromosome partitioning protein
MSSDWNEPKDEHECPSDEIAAEPVRAIDLEISLILVLGDRGQLDAKLVKAMAQSIVDQRLQTPIDVYPLKGIAKGKYGLGAGAHRLAAYELLGRSTIPARIISHREAKAWGPSENLHRRDLRVLERSESIVKYASARNKLLAKKPGGEQPADRSVSQLHRDLGFSRKLISDALLHGTIPEKVKRRIRGTKIEDNRSLLTKIANAESAAEQIRLVDAMVGKAGKGREKSRAASSNRPNNPDGSCDVDELLAIWAKSKLKKVFDRQSPSVQRAFVGRIAVEE